MIDPQIQLVSFLEHIEVERNVSRLTIRNYSHYLRRVINWFTDQGFSDLGALDLNVLRKYRVFLSRFSDDQGRTLSKSTQSYHIIELRSCFKWLIKQDLAVLHPEKI